MIRRSSSFNTARIDHIFGDIELVFGDLTDGSVLNQLDAHDPPGRGLQPRRAEPRARELRRPGVHGRRRRDGHAAPARRDPRGGRRVPLLPGVVERDVRPGARDRRRTRTTPFHPRSPYGVAQGVRLLDHAELPRGVRHVRRATGSSSTTSRRGAARRSSRGRSRAPSARSCAASRTSCGSATSTRSATGASRATTWRARGGCSRRTSPTTTSSPPARRTRSQEFLDEAFGYAGLDWRDYVKIDERYFRPAEVDLLIGDYSKAKEKLGWEPTVRFDELVRMMVDARPRARAQRRALRLTCPGRATTRSSTASAR